MFRLVPLINTLNIVNFMSPPMLWFIFSYRYGLAVEVLSLAVEVLSLAPAYVIFSM